MVAGCSPLEHPSRHQASHLPCYPRASDHVDYAFNVLVGDGGFFRELGVGDAPDDDAPAFELLAQHVAGNFSLRRGAAQGTSCAMTRAVERKVAGGIGAHQNERGGSHAPRNKYRLADSAIYGRNVGARWSKSAGCALSMNAKPLASKLLDLGDVVSDVVDQAEPRIRSTPKHTAESFAHPVREHLPIGPGEICSRAHRPEIVAPVPGRKGRACQLPVGN